MPLSGGIELGGTKCLCGVGPAPDEITAQVRIATTTPAETLGAALAFFRAHAPAALGVATFGPVVLDPAAPRYGTVVTGTKPGWERTDVLAPFRELGVPLALETDVNAAALGEYRYGAGRGCDPLVYVTVGTGIGGGALIDGKLLHGLFHPEMGHLRVPRHSDDDFAGACEWHGDCLEGLAAAPALRARWGADPTALPDDHPAWKMEAHYLAHGLAAIVATLTPQRIVLGGGVMRRAPLPGLVRARLRALLGGYLPVPALGDGIDEFVVSPGLGERSGLVGVLALAGGALHC